MASFYNSTSKQDMKADFPIQKIEPISGEPTMEWLMATNKKLVRCAKTQATDHGPLGLIFIVLHPNTYAQMTTMPVGNIMQPPNAPIIRAEMNSAAIEATKLEWSRRKKEWENCKNMNELMIDMLLDGLDQEFKEDLEEQLVIRPNVMYLEILNTLISRHGRITPPILEQNQDKMRTPWDPSTPIQTMFTRIRKAAEFGDWANKPITEADQIAAGENRILEAGIIPTQYQE